MEFYELNRLYDFHLENFGISKIVDHYLYILMPILISFGCGISLISIIALSRPYFNSTSKKYLYSQSIFNFLFQIITSIIFITNYYEKQLMNAFYFKNNKTAYFNFKIFLNLSYNVILYILIWLFVIGALDYCFISIIKFHFSINYSKLNRKLFYQQQAQFNYQQKLLHQQQSRLKNKPPIIQMQRYVSSSSSHSSFSFNPNGTVEESLPTENYFSNNFHNIYDSTTVANANSPDTNLPDESNMFELDFGEKKSKRKPKKEKDKNAVSFFKQSTIIYSIILIILLSILLAVPQQLAFEVKHNYLSISPSPMPPIQNPENSNKGYENVYFIEQDYIDSEYGRSITKSTDNLSYSRNIAKALGFSIRINQDSPDTNEIIHRMRKTHSKFFTNSGFFNLASKHYDLCNMVKNIEQTPSIRRPAVKLIRSNEKDSNRILIVNITLICIKKNELNNYLTYNTLYFWLEHTMVISAPICIIFVVVGSLIYTCVNFSKLLIQQNKIRQKRKKLFKLQQQQHGLNNNYNLNSCSDRFIQTNQHPKQPPKMVQIKSNDDNIDIINQPNANDDYINSAINAEFEQHNYYENQIRQKQAEDQDLNKMFIIDLILYVFISCPYTLMRLILDLFSKDHIKINLDFFTLYNISLFLFHLHLIIKFFLMLSLNVKFRISLAKAFSFQPSNCFIKGYDQEFEKYNHNQGDNYTDSKLKCILCFCCTSCCLSRFFSSKYNSQSSLNECNKNGLNYEIDDENDRSTEFNSNLHQYHCPADPDQEMSFQAQNRSSVEKFNLIENQS